MRYFLLAFLLGVFVNAPVHAEGWDRKGGGYDYSGGATYTKSYKRGTQWNGPTRTTNSVSSTKVPAQKAPWRGGVQRTKPVATTKPVPPTKLPTAPIRVTPYNGPAMTTYPVNPTKLPDRKITEGIRPIVDDTVTLRGTGARGVDSVCPGNMTVRERSKCLDDLVKAQERVRKKYD